MNHEKLYKTLKEINPFLPHVITTISGPCDDCDCGFKGINNENMNKSDFVELLISKAKKCKSITNTAIEKLMNEPELKIAIACKELVNELTEPLAKKHIKI